MLFRSIEEDDKKFIIKWINESEENYQHFAKLKNIWDNTHLPFSPNEIQTDTDYKKLSAKIKKTRNLKPLTWLSRIAAIFIISILSVSIYKYFIYNNITEPVYQEIFAPYGTFSSIELPDGSLVYLNSGSQLKYPVQFKKGERLVQLNGEALFEVKADKNNPFVVSTQSLTVTATGTIFQVEDLDRKSVV